MTISAIQQLMQESFQVGYMQAMKTFEPSSCDIRETEVNSWLSAIGVSRDAWNRLKKTGLVQAFRKGNSPNSPLYYSKLDIKKALIAKDLCKWYTDGLIG